jgi:endonuclease-3 related protein
VTLPAFRRNGQLSGLFRALAAAHGPQGGRRWWPAESAFEVVAGAVLVQNTSWRSAAEGVTRLKQEGLLAPRELLRCSDTRLDELLRPSGTFRVKRRRLRAVSEWFASLDGAPDAAAVQFRRRLLAVHGVGPETADSILVYAFGVPRFVVDKYARRIFARTGAVREALDMSYEVLSAGVDTVLPATGADPAEAHALLVSHAQRFCLSRPRCAACPLSGQCAAA